MRWFFSLLLLVTLESAQVLGETCIIRPDGSGDYPTIQAALNSAACDTIALADGTFRGDGNRDIDYHGQFVTIRSLSGDPAACIIDCEGSETDPHRGFDFHTHEWSLSVLQGVTIRNGCAWGSEMDFSGGAIYCRNGARPRITGCVFSDNVAALGGAVCCYDASPTVIDCTFLGNAADAGAGLQASDCSPAVIGCVFSGNHATAPSGGGVGGGGIHCSRSSAAVTRCSFVGNSADYDGGAMVCYESSPSLTDCEFISNSAIADGGAVYCLLGSSPTFTGCVFLGNRGAVFAFGGAVCSHESSPVIQSCTFARNGVDYGTGGAVYCRGSSAALSGCTFSDNDADLGAGLYLTNLASGVIENTIIAFSTRGEAVHCDATSDATLGCCDLYDNAGGDWVGSISDQAGVNGNFSADPIFCDRETDDLTVAADSPCLPGNHPYGYDCGLVGAHGQGCDATVLPSAIFGGVGGALRMSPNPCESPVRLTYAVSGGPGSISVFDVTGRLIRSYRLHVPVGALSWDGRDSVGRPVASGTYFVRIASGDWGETSALVLTR